MNYPAPKEGGASVPIKVVEVDKGILPVVKWLNSFEGIFTRWSCEGDLTCNPYVIFYCENSLDLVQVCMWVNCAATVEVSCDSCMLRYKLVFATKQALECFANSISMGGQKIVEYTMTTKKDPVK